MKEKGIIFKKTKTGRNAPCPCGSGKKFKKCHGAIKASVTSPKEVLRPKAKRKPDYKELGAAEYNRLPQYEETRLRELSEVYSVVIKLLQDYEGFVCRIVVMLGDCPPKDRLDGCIRDLICDVFDVLYLGKDIILRNHYPLGFPLLRRAYETVCLLHFFELAPENVEKWENGHHFDNNEIRKFLDKHPMGEKEDTLRTTYRQFSSGTHVNRDFIPHRWLGEGNQFTLGAIVRTDLFITSDYLEQMVRLWYWSVAIVAFHYKEVFASMDDDFLKDYLEVAKGAQPAIEELYEHKIRMREEMRDE